MSVNTKSAKNPVQKESHSSESFVIIDTNSWEPENHVVGLPKKNKSGKGLSASLTYGGKRFYLRLPSQMQAPFGASAPFTGSNDGATDPSSEQSEGKGNFTLQLSVSDNLSDFLEKAKRFDDYILDQATKSAVTNGDAWGRGGKSSSYETLKGIMDDRYKSFVKNPKNTPSQHGIKYPPTIRAQLKTDATRTNFTTEFYSKETILDTESGAQVPKELVVSTDPDSPDYIRKVIPSQSRCSALLSASIWVTGGGFGVTWKVEQVRVFPNSTLPKGKCLLTAEPEEALESDPEEATNATETSNVEVEEENEVEVEVEVEETEVEVEVEPEVIREPTPPPVQVQTPSTKKGPQIAIKASSKK